MSAFFSLVRLTQRTFIDRSTLPKGLFLTIGSQKNGLILRQMVLCVFLLVRPAVDRSICVCIYFSNCKAVLIESGSVFVYFLFSLFLSLIDCIDSVEFSAFSYKMCVLCSNIHTLIQWETARLTGLTQCTY